jgi:hypothetical protein
MDDGDVRNEIAQLEARIEALSVSIERCRKISLGAKIAIAGGALWFALALLLILPFDATPFVAALSAVLGGVVLLGSNATTWAQTEQALRAAETMRADMIGGIELRLIGDERPTIH